MVFNSISKAFIKAVDDSQAGLGDDAWPIAHENDIYNGPNGDEFIEMFLLPAQPVQASLGDQGCDRHDGIMQLTLNYPVAKGRTKLDKKADELNAVFKSGSELSEEGLQVRIANVGIQPLAVERGFARMALSIEYFAYSQRL